MEVWLYKRLQMDFIQVMMETSSKLPQFDYGKFIEVYGNKYKRQHFIAMRFLRPIISYKCLACNDQNPIEPPDDSIVVIRGGHNISFKNESVLLFTIGNDHLNGIKVVDESINTLLRSLFPPRKIIYSYFKNPTLYLVATENPYEKILKVCRKTIAFQTLVMITEAKKCNRHLTLKEIANLRFFKRHCANLKQFNRWSPFAFHLCFTCVYPITHTLPSESIGRQIFQILKRSDTCPEKSFDADFYTCEIFLTNSEPVGIICLFSKDPHNQLEYVSPMVVKQTKETFRDNNYVVCNTWMALYKDRETWKKFGLPFYVQDLIVKKAQLMNIILWLQLQTVEKYNLLYKDLVQVANILFGHDQSRWFLKP